MAFKMADRVLETTTSWGTGTIDLNGAEAGFQSFVDGIGDGVETYYAIVAPNGQWETGSGTVTVGTGGNPNRLSRTTVIDGSSGEGVLVNFANIAAAKDVFCDVPASKLTLIDPAGDLEVTGLISSGPVEFDSTVKINGLTYTFPATQAANRYLKTDGSGNLTWSSTLETLNLTDLLNVTTTSEALGDMLYRASSVWQNLAGNTTATKKFLSQTGTGSASAAPSWAQVLASDVVAGTFSGSFSFAGTLSVTSASSTAVAVGPSGTTNPAWLIDSSAASLAAGLKLTGATASGTVALAVISSGTNANLSINAKGTGTIAIGTSSTGNVTVGAVVHTNTGAMSGITTLGMSGAISINGTTDAQVYVNRSATNKEAIVRLQTAGVNKWGVGTGFSADEVLHIWNYTTGADALTIAPSNSAVALSGPLTVTSVSESDFSGDVGIKGAHALLLYKSDNSASIGLAYSGGIVNVTAGMTLAGSLAVSYTSNVATIIGRFTNAGTGEADFVIERTGGTASAWTMYLPSGNTDLRWYSGGVDRLSLSAAGVLTASAGLTVTTGTTAVQAFTATTVAATGIITARADNGALAMRPTTTSAASYIVFQNSAGTEIGYMGYGSATSAGSALNIYNELNGPVNIITFGGVSAASFTATGVSVGVGFTVAQSASSATITINPTAGGSTDAAQIVLQRNGTSKWIIGNNVTAGSDTLSIAVSGVGTSMDFNLSTRAVSVATALTVGAGFGCNGASAQTAFSVGAAATDLASVITLANNLRTMARNNGMAS